MTTLLRPRPLGDPAAVDFEPSLIGRARELAALEAVVGTVRCGRSSGLVLHGEAGIGKTALLHELRERATDCDVAHVAAAHAEMDLPFAVLDQLCRPFADAGEHLPAPQRRALDAAFGRVDADAGDRLLLSIAVLNLLREASAERPLVCLVDDAHWLDDASSAVLTFVMRRLGPEPVGVVFATRAACGDLGGLARLEVGGLADDEARALLASTVRRPLDVRVRERVILESGGNPAALLAAARASVGSPFAGGFDDPGAMPPPSDEASVKERVVALAEDARMVLLLAAAEPTGDPLLLWSAARMLGIQSAAADDAQATGLLVIGAQVQFCHPLVRGAVYRSVSPDERRLAHGALAAATNADSDPARHAWHRGREASTPDEAIAADLERSADRAAARGGIAAAAAFLRHATTLTPEPAERARRALAAAEAARLAGDVDDASRVLVTAEAALLDPVGRAYTHLLRARLGTRSGGPGSAGSLLAAARKLEPLDADRAREAYLDALVATAVRGEHAGARPIDVAKAALAVHAPETARPVGLLLEGLARQVVDGPAAAIPILRRALTAFDTDDLPAAVSVGWGWLASYVAAALWDHEADVSLVKRHLAFARREGALATLPRTLSQLAGIHLRNGELVEASELMTEASAVAQLTGAPASDHLPMLLAAFRGCEADARPLLDATMRRPGDQLGGMSATLSHYAAGVLYNGLGRYEDALAEARGALVDPEPVVAPGWALTELVEAATRAGAPADAAAAIERLSERTRCCGTDWALGLEARCRALVAEGERAEALYRQAITQLTTPASRVELARAHLLYGEWLRREGRRVDARKQLRRADDMLGEMGVAAFAERARRELRATGETPRRRIDDTRDDLTAQELQIAELARSGLSNPEIGARLFLSPRTVEWHLSKVFAKLDVRSRRELAAALPAEEPELLFA